MSVSAPVFAYKRGPKRARAKRGTPEEDFQTHLVHALTMALPEPYSFYASAVGVNVGPYKGARLKAMGVRAGWADLTIINLDTGGCRWLECKSKTGAASDVQKKLGARLGDKWAKVRTLEQAQAALLRWRVPLAMPAHVRQPLRFGNMEPADACSAARGLGGPRMTLLSVRVHEALCAAGSAKAAEIALRLDASAHSVRCALQHLRRHGVAVRIDANIDLPHAPGAVWSAVAGTLPKSVDTIWTPELIERMADQWKGGMSYTEIAAAIGQGVTRNTICGRLTRMGLTRTGPYQRTARLSRPARATNALGGAAVKVMKKRAERLAVTPAPKLAPGPVLSPNARPWSDRGVGECAYPVGGDGADTLSCCNLVTAAGRHYCAGHAAEMTVAASGGWRPDRLMRLARLAG